MRFLAIILFSVFVVSGVKSQEVDDDMRSFMSEEMQDFNKFISDANKEFVGFLREAWTEFAAERPVARFKYPEPPKPVVLDRKPDASDIPSTEIKVGSVVGVSNDEVPVPVVSPVEQQPTEVPPVEAQRKELIDFCGVGISVDGSLKGVCSLASLSENDVADAYEALSSMSATPLLNDINAARRTHHLNDWGVVVLVRSIADAFCPNHKSSVVMQQFLFNQLGFKTRMARREDRTDMMMFVAADCQLYGKPYTVINGDNYYNLDDNKACRFYMCKANYSGAKRSVVMSLAEIPVVGNEYVERKWVNRNGDVGVTLNVNKRLIDFYSTMPQCDFSVYDKAAVDTVTANALFAQLLPVVRPNSEKAAVGKLLDFVQTAFAYATDGEQFGYEKPFFVEETLFYPACDCEDRAVLFARFVRCLVGLDVVLLDYPNHIATAVCFNEDVAGDYLVVGGKKYVVCDPTYIGATIGMTMPQYKNVAPGVIK